MTPLGHNQWDDILFKQSMDSIVQTDAQFRITKVNPAFESLYGWDVASVLGKNPDILNADESREKIQRDIYQTVAKGNTFTGEALNRRKDGSTFSCRFKVSPIYNEKGDLQGYLSFGRDISSYKQSEHRTCHLNQVLGAIRNVNQLITHEQNSDILLSECCRLLTETRGYYNVWIATIGPYESIDIAAHLPVNVNASFEFGFNGGFNTMRTRLKNGVFPKCVCATIQDGMLKSIVAPQQMCTDCPLSKHYGGRSAFSVRLQHKERVYGWLCASIPAPYCEDTEEQNLFIEVANDIGFALYAIESEAQRRQLQKSLIRANTIVESSSVMLFRWHNSEGWPVEYVSENIARLGYTSTDFVSGRISYTDIVHPDDLQRISDEVKRYSKRGDVSFSQEYRIRNSDGDYIWITDCTKVERNSDGQVVFYEGVLLDITLQKRHHENLGKIAWLLAYESGGADTSKEPDYGDVSALNTERTILDSVGRGTLQKLADDVLALLGTSFAVYEKNGDYAFGSFVSDWCRLLDNASRNLCNTNDNRKALSCGSWLCHENCWNESAKVAIASGAPSDIACVGGIRLYAVPIFADDEIVGVVNMGYGTPPTDEQTLGALAGKFGCDKALLCDAALAFNPRPPFLIEIAKKRLGSIAMQIGKTVESTVRAARLKDALMIQDMAIHAGKVGFWDWDLKNNKVQYSDTLKAHIGYAPDEISDRLDEWRSRVHPDDLSSVEDAIQEAIDSKSNNYNVEFRFQHKDGSYRNIIAQGAVVTNRKGTPIRFVGSHLDVTRQREADRELHLTLKAISEGVWKWDFQTDKLAFSPNYYTMLGYEPDAFPADFDSWKTMIHPDDTALALQVVKSWLMTKRGVYKNVFRLRAKNGEYRWIHARGYVVERDANGDAIRMIGNHVDITALKKAENQIVAIEKRNQLLLDYSPSCHKIIDLDFNLQYMNKPGFKMLKLEPTTELYGKPYPFHFFPEESRNRLIGKMREVLQNGKNCCFEDMASDVEGNQVWLHHCIVPVRKESGEIDYLTVVSDDITDRLKIQNRLRQAEKMEAIGTLAGGIAHDFNNVLGGILGFADMAMDDVPTQSPIAQKIQYILEGVDRAKQLVNRILNFSRFANEEKTPQYLRPVLSEVVRLVKASLPPSIELKSELARDTRSVFANPTQIHEVVMNLCTNAAYALKNRKGTLEVCYEETVLDKEIEGFAGTIPPGMYSRITVRDNGCGMDGDTLNRVFDPFFTTKPLGEGTGMGMAMIYGIVQNHEGAITVKSAPGKGTAVSVYLPNSDTAIIDRNTEAYPPVQGGTERILFVDDEDIIGEMADSLLSSLGYAVTVCNEPYLALKLFQEAPESFDLVITDQIMADLSGMELARKIREARDDIPVILCTGYSRLFDEEKALAAGIDAFLAKPFRKRVIAHKIHAALLQRGN